MSWKDKIEIMKAGKIDIDSANTELEILLDKYDWFHSSIVENNFIRVYVNYMNADVLNIIPNVLYGYEVDIAFTAYLTCAEKYGKLKFPNSFNSEEEYE